MFGANITLERSQARTELDGPWMPSLRSDRTFRVIVQNPVSRSKAVVSCPDPTPAPANLFEKLFLARPLPLAHAQGVSCQSATSGHGGLSNTATKKLTRLLFDSIDTGLIYTLAKMFVGDAYLKRAFCPCARSTNLSDHAHRSL